MSTRASMGEAFGMAIGSLRASKLRSFLTLLGIILATATLIAVMSVINGMNVYVAEKIADMGADGFVVVRMAFLGDFSPKKFLELLKKNPELGIEEYEFLRSHVTLLRDIGMRSNTQAPVNFGQQRMEEVNVTGGTANLSVLTNVQVETGRYFTETEDENHRMVVLIGHDVKDQFFPNTDPIGKTIGVAGLPFQVVGVAKKVGSVFGQSQDNFVQIPIRSFFKIWGNKRWISYAAQAHDHGTFYQAMDEVRALLRARRHVAPGADDNFSIVTSDSILDAWDQLTRALAGTAVGIVSVFMVVGGVVIMNIMLAVVTERTQEIGIRKSIGARRQDILNQFLIESSVLALMGGVIGVGIAWVAALVVRSFTPVPMELPLTAVAAGVGISAAVGLFFGIYPAQRAARLDPIEALRAEK
ncbi:MAG: ABC transporter permease [Bryobacterales bacterium]|nr:ABC transporter permease [Bryobacterales bacterium]